MAKKTSAKKKTEPVQEPATPAPQETQANQGGREIIPGAQTNNQETDQT